MLSAGLAAAFLLAACGTPPNGPTTAENQALAAIPAAEKVVSYPIPASGALSYLPASEKNVGTPAYAFTLRLHGLKQPLWVLAGPKGAHPLKVYPNLQDASAHAAAFDIATSLFATAARGAVGKLPLAVIGARAQQVSGQMLRKLGLKLSGSSYQVLAVVSLPANPVSPHLNQAHFVIAQGRVVAEYGSSR
jgi:hypothetical protein